MNDRIALLILEINQRRKMKVIQVFASAASYHGQEVIEIYQEIENLMKKEKRQVTITMRDLNAKLGKKEDKKSDSYGKL